MKISTKGRYALRMMVDLAEHQNGEYISLKDYTLSHAPPEFADRSTLNRKSVV